ncbi:hypothetical protein [Clostridium ganghwense]|uniref:Uncharacterized protein n=1 Tax=Clostridium ganghwense TaxID=312089 RepID=A0ABT4CRJ8_9CLOT|nr:hypothetical protein [Clostridium ganghwense]MCY6371676.1 hypothetical protein [Clostridium ganghwense]
MDFENTANVNLLIEDLENILDEMFLRGLGCAYNNIIEDINIVSKKCKDIGLFFATEKLDNIKKELSKKQHSMNFNYSKVVEEYYALSVYVNVIK